MSTVEVRLYAGLRRHYPALKSGEALSITLDDEASLQNLLSGLKAPREEIAIVMVNGKREAESYLLQDGDRIGVFPLIGGG